jgi:pheromone shutdown-related protein TraB
MMIKSDDVHQLKYGEKEITLVGTAHVSRESADLVQQVIEEQRPDTVCVELCQARYQSITQKKQWQNTDLIKVIKEKKAHLLLLNLILTSYQRKIGEKLGVKPGEEFLRAIHAAEIEGALIHLSDRDIRITLSRTWTLMGFWTKMRLLAEKDVLEALLSELGKVLPELRSVLIDERDQYLASKIRNAPGKRIVAVLGAGHVPGVQRYWHEAIDIEALEKMPPKGRFSGAFKWAFSAFVVGLLVFGFFSSGSVEASDMIKWWVVAKSAFAGLGAAVALGHPASILSAIVVAPISPLNPVVKVGFIAGLVETLVGKPKVRDFEALVNDISTVRGFWKNKISRILLVVVLTNAGSALGTFVALSLLVKVLT